MAAQQETDFQLIQGKRIEYRRIGIAAEGQPTLVFLHEGLGSHDMWKDFPDRVAAATGLPALIYSRPGYGRSDPAPLPRAVDFMHEEALDVLPRLIDSLDITATVPVGHSDGGSIALIFAAGNPAVSALVLLAPHVFIEQGCIARTAELAAQFRRHGIPDRLRRYHNDAEHTFSGWVEIILSPEFREWNIEGLLPDIRAPVLLIQGKNDEFWTEAQPRAIEAQAGGIVEVHMLDDCGHSPHRDRPERTISIITGFTAAYLR